jgi:hypothetical protein
MDYDLAYYDNMLRNYSSSAEKICAIRWEWIKETDARKVLDYGSGVGWFRAFAPKGVEVDTTEILSVPQTGIRHANYDVLTLWDVLEHLPSLSPIEELLKWTRYVAISVPILPEGALWTGWKHFKPTEHLFYPTAGQLGALFGSYGFSEVKRGQPECPPRQDIWNFLYEKVDLAE